MIFTVLAFSCALLPTEWIAVGLGLSLSFATGIQTVVAALLIRRRSRRRGRPPRHHQLRALLVAAVPAGLAGLGVLIGISSLLGADFAVTGFVGPLVSMAVIGVVMLAVYLGGLALLRSPELKMRSAPCAHGWAASSPGLHTP